MKITIRQAKVSDIHTMMTIEMSASKLFTTLPEILLRQLPNHLPPHDEAFYQRTILDQTSWIICANEEPVGFLCATMIASEKTLHIEEIDIALPFQGKGLGKKLLKFVIDFAIDCSLSHITLTTFKAVPWNAAFYQKYDFITVEKTGLNKRLQNILKEEALIGLPENTRCAMVMNLKK